jgi:hypothetical protein
MVSEAILRARWVEAEVMHLKKMGLAFDTIADQIMRVGRGQAIAMVPITDGVTFLPNYKISKQACHKAFRRAIAREPAIAVSELRTLDGSRSEELWMNLQPGIRKGNPRSIEVGVKVLDHTARIQGYAAPQKHEFTGKDGKPMTLVHLLNEIGPVSEEE